MAETRAIKRFIDVEIEKVSASTSSASFSIPLLLSNSSIITATTRVREFTSLASVELFFDKNSEEYKACGAYFLQDPFNDDQPSKMLIGRFVSGDSNAVLELGESPLTDVNTWKTISSGNFSIDVDGTTQEVINLDFSLVTSLDDVASVITAASTGFTCTFVVNRFLATSDTTGVASTISLLSPIATPSGTDISGTGFLDGDSGVISNGQAIETAEECIDAIKIVNSEWFAIGVTETLRTFATNSVLFIEDVSDEIERGRNLFIVSSNDINTTVLGNTTSFSAITKEKNYRRTVVCYHTKSEFYVDWSIMGAQLPKAPGSTNWGYQELATVSEGALVTIEPDLLSKAQLEALLIVNTNAYTETTGSTFFDLGITCGGRDAEKNGEFIDTIVNIDFLQARLEETLLGFLISSDIVDFSNAGISQIESVVRTSLLVSGVATGILVDGTISVSFPERSQVSAQDRAGRLLPSGTFSADLSGAINQVVVRGSVSV